jgi:2-hydroxycyclohexanecarboxyl-CoA dehydrogenase
MRVTFDGKGDTIVITGGANGIGRALAVAACDTGARVVVCDHDQRAMANLTTERPSIASRLLDVSDRDSVIAVFDNIAKDVGPIAFSSGTAHQGWPKTSAYAASKAALIAFVKSAAKEVVSDRVRINLIFPGVIDTPQYRAANQGADDERWRMMLGVGLPQDVVGSLLFLLSDAATMTASILSRDVAYSHNDFEQAP